MISWDISGDPIWNLQSWVPATHAHNVGLNLRQRHPFKNIQSFWPLPWDSWSKLCWENGTGKRDQNRLKTLAIFAFWWPNPFEACDDGAEGDNVLGTARWIYASKWNSGTRKQQRIIHNENPLVQSSHPNNSAKNLVEQSSLAWSQTGAKQCASVQHADRRKCCCCSSLRLDPCWRLSCNQTHAKHLATAGPFPTNWLWHCSWWLSERSVVWACCWKSAKLDATARLCLTHWWWHCNWSHWVELASDVGLQTNAVLTLANKNEAQKKHVNNCQNQLHQLKKLCANHVDIHFSDA